jgi:hypothetical protein
MDETGVRFFLGHSTGYRQQGPFSRKMSEIARGAGEEPF